jgi:hypothetical protein
MKKEYLFAISLLILFHHMTQPNFSNAHTHTVLKVLAKKQARKFTKPVYIYLRKTNTHYAHIF